MLAIVLPVFASVQFVYVYSLFRSSITRKTNLRKHKPAVNSIMFYFIEIHQDLYQRTLHIRLNRVVYTRLEYNIAAHRSVFSDQIKLKNSRFVLN